MRPFLRDKASFLVSPSEFLLNIWQAVLLCCVFGGCFRYIMVFLYIFVVQSIALVLACFLVRACACLLN